MSTSFFQRRFALVATHLLFPAALLVPVLNTRADDVTYNIVDYPVNETDENNSQTDTLSGTIVTDGNTSVLTPSDILGGSYVVSNPVTCASVAEPILGSLTLSATLLSATPTNLLLAPGGNFYTQSLNAGLFETMLDYQNNGVNSIYQASAYIVRSPTGFNAFSTVNPAAVPGSIATVPEPAPALFCTALLGLGAFYLRRRGQPV
ncbi:MAG: hypothetical protein ABSG53_15500 [Thermoguttaceae bacterium]|jgi:hypothetical protein